MGFFDCGYAYAQNDCVGDSSTTLRMAGRIYCVILNGAKRNEESQKARKL